MRDPSNSSEPDSNHYALPLPISPVVSPDQGKVIRIDFLPTGADNKVNENPGPWKVATANEYIPEAQELRKDLKPLHVVQPEGAGFKVIEQGTSRVVEWQKWSFRVGFNIREGMVLYNVSLHDSLPAKHSILMYVLGPLRQQTTVLPFVPLRHEHPIRRPKTSVPQEIRIRPR